MASYGPKYFSILFLVALLFPTFDGFDQHFGFAAGSVALRLVIMLLVLWFLMKFNFTIRFHSKAHVQTMAFLVILFSVFLFLVIWSLGNNISEVIMRDIFELHRPFYYAMLLMFPLLFRWSDYEIEKYVVKMIAFVIVIQIILGWLHAIHYSWYQDFIVIYTKVSNSISHRSTGTFGNPYDYGIFMLFAFILSGYYAIVNKFNVVSYVVAFLCLVAVFLSQSKTAFYVVFPVTLYAFFLGSLFSKNRSINFFSFFVLLVVVIVAVYLARESMLFMFERNFTYLASTDALDLGKLYNKSLENRDRLHDLLWVLDRLSNSSFINVLFGVEIGKSKNDDIEFGYAVFLFRYGVIGLLLYFYFFVLAIKYSYLSYRLAKRKMARKVEAFFFSFHIWSVGLTIATFANNFIDQPRHTFFFFTAIGISISYLFSQNTQFPPVKHPLVMKRFQ